MDVVMNSYSKNFVIRLVPIAIFICATITTMLIGNRYDFIGFYKSFLYVHGYIEGNIVFYFTASLYVTAYPILKDVAPKVTRSIFVVLIAFFVFQIEYALLTNIVTTALRLAAKDGASYINVWVSVVMLTVASMAWLLASLSRNTVLMINGVLLLAASISTYHTYALLVSVLGTQ